MANDETDIAYQFDARISAHDTLIRALLMEALQRLPREHGDNFLASLRRAFKNPTIAPDLKGPIDVEELQRFGEACAGYGLEHIDYAEAKARRT